MKKPIEADVFCTTNYFFEEQYKCINGNFYVKGLVDSLRFTNTLEVFGDLIIDSNLLVGNVIVHGDLICDGIFFSQKIEVDGDIYVSGKIKAKSIICKSGDIFFNEDIIEKT